MKAIDDWLSDLAAKQPTPGGGGVAALHAATAAALLGMVTSYTIGDKWPHSDQMQQLNEEVTQLRQQGLDLIEADAAAFATVGAAYRSKDEAAIQKALQTAAQPPCEVIKLASRLVEIVEQITDTGNPNVVSDVAVGATTAAAALESAVANIVINQAAMTDHQAVQTLDTVVKQAEQQQAAAQQVVKNVLTKLRKS